VRLIGGENHVAAQRRRGMVRLLRHQRVHLESQAAVD
jgi:hypothetical protein